MIRRVLLSGALAPVLLAQAGHWEGAIKQPDRNYLITLDLDNNPGWHGSFSIPGENAPPLPLAAIEIHGQSVRFEILELPGDPTFKGLLGENGADLKGVVVQNGRTLAFEMRRTGEPQVAAVPPNSPIHKEFLGEWYGSLPFSPPLKLVLHLRQDAEGLAAGSLDTEDKRARNLVLSAIRQEGASLAFEVRLIGGSFRGEMTGDGAAVNGAWTQNGREMPLALTRHPK